MKMLQAIILAGGLATRLRPVTETIPKSLVEVAGMPFVDHQLALLSRQGVSHVVMSVGYLGEMIEEHVGDGRQFGMRVQFISDGDQLLGTGGAIKNALPLLDDNFFVLYGDSYLDTDYLSVQQAFLRLNKKGLMTVFHNQGKWDTSNVEYRDGSIIAYDKKNITEQMRYIDYGLGVFNKSAFADVEKNQPVDLATLYQSLLSSKQLAGFEIKERFYEVGSFAGIKALESYLRGISEIAIA